MPSTGPTVFAGAPSVIAQISLESEAFRVAALNPAPAAASTRPTGVLLAGWLEAPTVAHRRAFTHSVQVHSPSADDAQPSWCRQPSRG
jgi:hypothetical protein